MIMKWLHWWDEDNNDYLPLKMMAIRQKMNDDDDDEDVKENT